VLFRGVFREQSVVPDVRDREDGEAKPMALEDRGPRRVGERRARARVRDGRAIEMGERLEQPRFSIIPGVVVRRGDDIDSGGDEGIGGGGRAIEDEVVRGRDGLLPLIADGPLEVDETDIGGAKQIGHGGKKRTAGLAQEDLPDEPAETDVARRDQREPNLFLQIFLVFDFRIFRN
jgi:hypothetical protein